MGSVIEFTIPGQPVGKQRPRFGKGGRVYTPWKTKKYEASVAKCGYWAKYSDNWKAEPDTNAYILECEIYFMKARGRKPDADNVLKAVMDGLQGVFWVDDGQVVPRCKAVHKDHPAPRVDVRIERVDR